MPVGNGKACSENGKEKGGTGELALNGNPSLGPLRSWLSQPYSVVEHVKMLPWLDALSDLPQGVRGDA